jgi:hypothetical protein
MKTFPIVSVVLLAALPATHAFAGDKAACLVAAQKGQRFRDTHKLVEAREQLRICAAAACPAVVQADCASWLADVERALPTVVLVAKSGAGVDLTDVKVSVDGLPLVSKLDGQAVALNAGPHTFHFEGADGTASDTQAVVKEGEKSQPVGVVLVPAPPQTPTTQVAVVSSVPPAASMAPTRAPEPVRVQASSSSSAWRTAGWVLGGVGVAGLGVGAAFGGLGLSAKGSDCTGNVCKVGSTSGIKTDALLSDVGFIAGGLLLAGGAAIVLFGPTPRHEAVTTVKLAPAIAGNSGGVVVGGSF